MSKNKKTILFLDDLVEFCKNHSFEKFSSQESGYKLVVHVPAQFEINQEQNDNSLLFCKVKLMHSGENRNHSSVTDDALVKCSKTLAYKPILANFMEYTDEATGEVLKDFTSHDMKINEDGTTTFLEKQVGCFTSDEPFFEVEEDTKHNFLYGYCAIPRNYTEASNIIERKNGTKISVELEVNEMQYSVTNHVLELTDVNILGATLLGKNPVTLKNVEEGMKNARLDIADFSAENNSIKFSTDNKMIELLESIDNKLSSFNIENPKKGGNTIQMNKFEQLLEQYGKTVEDITFDYESMSDEELEVKFKEVFEVKNDEPKTLVRSYEISHEDTRYALYNLLSAAEDNDNEWYFINSVYDTYFTYENWSGDKIYGQGYKVNDDDSVVLDGDRYSLHRELLTDAEFAELQAMRSNYAALKQFKENVEKNELHEKREAIVNDDKYTLLAAKNENGEYLNEAYAELIQNIDNYSLEELETKIKVIHSDYISEHSNFEYIDKNKTNAKDKVKYFCNLNTKSKPKKIYGNLFD